MSGVTTVWHGSNHERVELIEAVSHNCDCTYAMGVRAKRCAAHEMLEEDQRAIDRLVFIKRIAKRFSEQEFEK
jgi:hypothetical protein